MMVRNDFQRKETWIRYISKGSSFTEDHCQMYTQDLFGSKIKSNKLQHGKAGLPSSNLSFLCKLVFLNFKMCTQLILLNF